MAGGRPGDSGSIPAARGTATQGSGAVGWPWGLRATFGGPEPWDGAVGAGLRPSALRGGTQAVASRGGTGQHKESHEAVASAWPCPCPPRGAGEVTQGCPQHPNLHQLWRTWRGGQGELLLPG